MKNKKGMELSINFMVILILSIVVFGFGIKILSEIIKSANDEMNFTSDQIEKNLIDIMCDSSERVCVTPQNIKLRPHDSDYFTIGILNTYDSPQYFTINVEESNGIDIPSIGKKYWMLADNSLSINPNEQKRTGMGVLVPGGTKEGGYVLNIYICIGQQVSDCDSYSEDNWYHKPVKVYVNVPKNKKIFGIINI